MGIDFIVMVAVGCFASHVLMEAIKFLVSKKD